jgi:hypothetical protein
MAIEVEGRGGGYSDRSKLEWDPNWCEVSLFLQSNSGGNTLLALVSQVCLWRWDSDWWNNQGIIAENGEM